MVLLVHPESVFKNSSEKELSRSPSAVVIKSWCFLSKIIKLSIKWCIKIEISLLTQMPALTLLCQETELDTMELQLKVIKSKLKLGFSISLKSLEDYFFPDTCWIQILFMFYLLLKMEWRQVQIPYVDIVQNCVHQSLNAIAWTQRWTCLVRLQEKVSLVSMN